jgi:hypothetical protein
MGEVIINDLANLPHHDGQLVLTAEREDFAVEIKYHQATYGVYGFVRQQGAGGYTRLAAPRSTVADGTELARRRWRDGKDFDTICR